MPPAGGYHTSAMSVKEMLERLRVEDPRRYRQWYEQYQAHRRNPQRVPNPGLPQFGPVMGPHPPSTPGAPYSGYGGWQGGNGSVYAESTTDRERHSVHSGIVKSFIITLTFCNNECIVFINAAVILSFMCLLTMRCAIICKN